MVPRTLPGLERRKHSTISPRPVIHTHTHTHTLSRGVYAGIPAWTGGRHFLGMANPVPQPNQGDAVGCDGQRLQESKQAPGMEDVSLRPQGRVSLQCPRDMAAPQRLGVGGWGQVSLFFLQASQR